MHWNEFTWSWFTLSTKSYFVKKSKYNETKQRAQCLVNAWYDGKKTSPERKTQVWKWKSIYERLSTFHSSDVKLSGLYSFFNVFSYKSCTLTHIVLPVKKNLIIDHSAYLTSCKSRAKFRMLQKIKQVKTIRITRNERRIYFTWLKTWIDKLFTIRYSCTTH